MSFRNTWTDLRRKQLVLVVGPVAVLHSWEDAVDLIGDENFLPMNHQIDIAEFIKGRKGAAVFAEVGTGKTVATLLGLNFGRHSDIELVDATTGSSVARAERIESAINRHRDTGKATVVYINHESVWRKAVAKVVDTTPWDAVVIDESQRIKSPGSKVSRWAASVAKKCPAARRIILTGTPCPKDPLDVYGQLRFVDSSILGTRFSKFRDRLARMHPKFPSKVEQWKSDGIEWLKGEIDNAAIQVRADDVLDLPEELHRKIPVKLSHKTFSTYRKLEKDFVAGVGSGTITASNALVLSSKLRQSTSGQIKDDEGNVLPIDGIPDKRIALQEFLAELPSHEPVVVFCQFTADLEEIEAACRTLDRDYCELSGRRKEISAWEQGVIGVQAQAGGAGVNLQQARIAVFYSTGWSAGEFTQCMGRIRRQGQKASHCLYVHLIATHTIDEVVYSALRKKQRVVDTVVDGLRRDIAA